MAIRTPTYARRVERLDSKDVSALLAFVGELRDLDDAVPFPPRLLGGLQRLVPSDTTCYSELKAVNRTSCWQIYYDDDGHAGIAHGGHEEKLDGHALFWELRNTHPVCAHRARTGDWTSPHKVSDFATLREFRRTAIYDAFFRGEVDHWFDLGLPSTGGKTRTFLFTRFRTRDFDERDRLVARLLAPHLEERAVRAAEAASAASELAEVVDGTGDAAHRAVLCSASGDIEFASRPSRSLLARYLGIDNGRLPAWLLARRLSVVAGDEATLTVRIARAGTLRLLLLEERDNRVQRLTPRERQVLELVARGLENDGIALELGIASATVAKHLEHVYEKLGVRNRTAAAAFVRSRDRDAQD